VGSLGAWGRWALGAWGRWVGSPWVGVGARCGGGGLAVDGGCSPWGCPPRSVLGEAAAADPFLRPSVLSV